MDGWLAGQALPCWFGPVDSSQFVAVSVEPSGLVLTGYLDPLLFRGWTTKLCAKLTATLGREVSPKSSWQHNARAFIEPSAPLRQRMLLAAAST